MQRGFTLIEVLIVIGIIAILASIVIVAINPAKQFAQARNTQREAAVSSILNAIGQRMADNKGIFEGTFAGGAYTCPPITTSTSSIVMSTPGVGEIDLSCLVPTYIAALPVDPVVGLSNSTGFDVIELPNGRLRVCAPEAGEESALPDATAICVTR